ncbi:KGGVGR-motif variant AAA ATPase [Streptomyces sp. NPDC059605]|uniref:KGGVGR-motif variant AAA ATPase n=1 Tax=unclassified Streptomyces TaxID=2593676 RepID=UPI0036B7F362
MAETYRAVEAVNLFTWVDVDERLSAEAAEGRWPDWLMEADAWWDGLELTVRSGTEEPDVRRWLDDVFGTGSSLGNPGELVLALDRPAEVEATGLPVTLLPDTEYVRSRRDPRLMERRITAELADFMERPTQNSFVSDVQMLAFHSFKGGAGRTVHAVALADELARRGRRVLLVDGDLEAPGITWMYQAQGGACDVAYEDVLALLHGTPRGGQQEAIAIAAPYLANQEVARHREGGSLVVLPASRRLRLGPPRIEPAHLITKDRPAYFLTESLAELAAEAGLDTVLIDLRAGASELSAPVLLDPRIQRVFVTTLSSQSLEGTEQLICQLGNKAPSLEGTDPAPAAVVTQYRLDAHTAEAEQAKARLAASLECFTARYQEQSQGMESGEVDGLDTAGVDSLVRAEPLLSPFREELLALPRSWDDVIDVVRRCGVSELVGKLVPELPVAPLDGGPLPEGEGSLEERRGALHKRARSLVFAERSGLDSGLGFLSTEPLRRLVGDHRTSLPVTVVVGAKGAGKTFTYARLCAAARWAAFAEHAQESVQADAPVVPVLDPGNMDQYGSGASSEGPQALRDRSAGGQGARPDDIRSLLQDALDSERREDQRFWRSTWLQCMAVAADGPGALEANAEEVLLHRNLSKPVLFVFDGLEDFFQDLESDAQAKRMALRTLFTDVPDWFRMMRSRRLGLVIFARKDLVRYSLRQNVGQFLDRYDPYELRWDAHEALRLALWVATTAGAVHQPEEELALMAPDAVVQALIPVWGAKLGRDNSREAWTERWVPAALADFNEQVQARDVVRFLRDAAELSMNDEDWPDRLLSPSALRMALVRCSVEKLKELQQENPSLGNLLRSVGSRADEVVMPFEAEAVGLDANGIVQLEEAGALARDSDGRYRLPEIYRHALGFRTRGRARVVRG